VSPTTGVCRKLVVQAVKPSAPSEVRIKNHTNQATKLAIWLLSNSPIRGWTTLRRIGIWLFFSLKLHWTVICILVQIPIDLTDDSGEDTELYNMGYYKPYARTFQGQLCAARSTMEY